jgi:hypothetical protein
MRLNRYHQHIQLGARMGGPEVALLGPRPEFRLPD